MFSVSFVFTMVAFFNEPLKLMFCKNMNYFNICICSNTSLFPSHMLGSIARWPMRTLSKQQLSKSGLLRTSVFYSANYQGTIIPQKLFPDIRARFPANGVA